MREEGRGGVCYPLLSSSPPYLSPVFKALSANVTSLDEGDGIELS